MSELVARRSHRSWLCRRVMLIALVGALTACGGVVAIKPASTSQSGSIPVAVLAAHGITVTPVSPGTSVAVSEAKAQTVALGRLTAGSAILGNALMQVNDDASKQQCTCWVFSVAPAGAQGYQVGPGPGDTQASTVRPRLRTNFAIIAVDSGNGAVVIQVEGRDPSLPDFASPTATSSSP